MTELSLPSIDYPFLGAVHPAAAVVEKTSLMWAMRFGLLNPVEEQRRARLRYGVLAAHAYPQVTQETLQVAADWISWLFLMDDQCDEAGIGHHPDQLLAVHTRFLAILNGTPPTRDDWPLTHALADIYHRLTLCATEPLLQRFVGHAELYFAANRWEATNRQRCLVPNTATYCAVRLFSGAVYTCFDLIELTEPIELPFYVRQHMTLQRIAHAANNLICWCNDLLSFQKELQHGDVHNLVLVLQHEHQCSLQEAVAFAKAQHDAEVTTFLQLAAQVPRFDPQIDAHLDRLIQGFHAWVRANLDWSLTAIRYAADRSVGDI